MLALLFPLTVTWVPSLQRNVSHVGAVGPCIQQRNLPPKNQREVKGYSPPEVDRIWLSAYFNMISIYDILFTLYNPL